ncbi:MotA/TolQ/ExbB proton channel family protein [Rubritalea spongiae]|uniref:MotA/TolQ/ExbB proton channel family protein n=1 Tax=Rubritalea spongiae TaxID=430797 RepID=A0ABW5E213_9BACT
MHSILQECQTLLDQGGVVLWIILAVGVWLYTMLLATWRAAAPLCDLIREGVSGEDDSKRFLMNEYTIFQLDKLAWVDRRIPVIGVMIGVCTLGGLLGTVSGMLATFENMASASQADPMQKIASGISEALVTTQAGLLVALPAAFMFALLKSRVSAVHALLEENLHADLAVAHRKETV